MDELCFADAIHIQPCVRGVVESANAAYLTVDGCTIRRIPNNVMGYAEPEDYRKFYDWLLGERPPWLDGITVEPPSGEKDG
jgi:hypothetical protein